MATEQGVKILQYLEEHGSADSMHLAKEWNEPHSKIVGTVKSMLCLGNVIVAVLESSSQWVLTEEGQGVVSAGSHEALVYNAVPAGGSITLAEIWAKIPSANVGFSKAIRNGWITLDKRSGTNLVIRKIDKIDDVVQKHLVQLDELDASLKTEYRRRNLIQEITVKSYKIKPGPSFTTSVKKQDTELTPEMIASGSWKDITFKPYNLEALGVHIVRGHLPLMKFRSEMRQILLEMGFLVMPSHNFVESSFWNFDALFQPQQHPARDTHDNFFINSDY